MQQLVFIIHILAAVFLMILILMQHGKGADMGAAFGSGASQTVFGSVGSLPLLIKVTALVAAIFFISSVGLGYLISHQVKQSDSIANSIQQQSPNLPQAPAPAAPTQTAPAKSTA